MSLGYRVIPFKNLTNQTIHYCSKLKTIKSPPLSFYPPLLENNAQPWLIEQPWLMYPKKSTTILQHKGFQSIELFNPIRDETTLFTLKSNKIFKNRKVYMNGLYLFEIEPEMFFRSVTGNFESVISSPIEYRSIQEQDIDKPRLDMRYL